MSITAFKRKSVIQYGSKRSGSAPGGVWLPQGPFGHSANGLQLAIQNPGNSGFSINGGRRNVGGVGKDMKMSKSGTPYRGTEAIGWGGTYGKYPSAVLIGGISPDGQPFTSAVSNSATTSVVQPVLNSQIVNTQGNQYTYIKPSTLSTKGMLAKKYRWIHNGVYPNYWVQPNYTGNQVDTASQGLYVQNLASIHAGNLDVNNTAMYVNNIVKSSPTLCTPGTSTARFTFNDMARNGPYTKTLNQPVTYGHYNLRLTRKCNNPVGPQKPFPFAVQTGRGQFSSGTGITSFSNGCNTSITYLTPPAWYTAVNPGQTVTSATGHQSSSSPICGQITN
jgi:hypothetical protein